MTQYVINIGAIPNDGTGDPLRTAFNETNLNFNQIFAAGPVLSNIQIANNKILTTNTNGNLVLAPNGTGVVQSNVSIVPNTANIRNLGSSTQRWNTVYTQYLSLTRDLTVGGNLIVTGNTINMGNIVTDALTIQLGNTVTNPAGADGAGITVGENDDIATFLFDSGNNAWATNIGLEVNGSISGTELFVSDATVYGNIGALGGNFTGNVTANYFVGNGSQLTGIVSSYGNSNVVTLLSSYGSNTISTTGNVTVGNILPAGYVSATGNVRGANFNTVGIVSATGNITGDYFIGNGSQLTGISAGANIGNLDIVGTTISIANGAPETYINISSTVEGWAYVQVPTDATANVTDTRIHNDAGNIEFGTGDYSTGETNYIWTLDNAGNLTFPDNSGSGWPVNTQRFGMGNIGAWLDGQWTIGEFSGNGVSGEFGIRIDPSIEGPVGMTFPSSASSNTQPVQIYSTNGGGISLTTGGPEWTFDSNGNLTAPGGITGANLVATNSLVSPQLAINLTNYNWSDPIVGITLGANTIVTLANNVFGDPYSGQVTIEGVNGTTQANGNWYYVATNPNEFELFDDAEGTPVDSTSWTAYTDGGLAFTLGYGNLEINAQNITIRSDHGDYDNKIWSFNRDGSTVFPTLTVDLHNGGTQTGQTLQFGDPTQQAIITGPTPAVDNNAQRLIIQGQRGNGTGEGGDVYLWAGDAQNNGGDIKIYAGDADAGNVGDIGGYVNIDGGSGYTRGGQVEITGGYSSSGDGGYTNLRGGQGNNGGNVGIQAGYGQAGPGGAVTIQGGASANGLAEYGNVGISAGASSWAFDNTGILSLPGGGAIYSNSSTPSGNPGNTIVLQPAGSGITTDQKLLVYPTAADGDHIHLTSGNLYQTELFLGSDNLYVKLSNTGNIVINSNDNTGNTKQWTFDALGNLNLPQGGYIGAAGVKGDGTMLTGGTGQIASLTSFYADAPGIYAGCFTANPDGTVNITTYGNGTGQAGQWTFDNSGNLTVAGNIIMPAGSSLVGDGASPAPSINGFDSISAVTFSAVGNVTANNLRLTGGQIQSGVPTVVADGINSISLSLGAQMDVFGFPFTTTTRGQLTITGDISTTEALGTWYYQSTSTNTYQLYTDSTYTTLVDATTWTPYTGGGSVAITENIPLANVVINANGFQSTFTTGGDLVVPGDIVANNIVAESPFTIQAGNFAAVAGARYGVDTYSADGPVTATLPAAPATGDSVFFADAGNYAQNGALTINAGSNTIMDNGNTLVVSTNNQSVGLFWNGRTWRIYNAG